MGYIDYQCQQQDKHIQLPTTALLLTNMRGFLLFTSSIAFVLGAPQFLSEKNQNENCHTEVVTIFEESEAESVNKVICETEFRDSCEVVPHEECKQVVEKVPQKVSKKVTKVVCDDKESMSMETEPEVPDLNDILEIFGVTSGENEIDSNDAKTTETTSTTTTRSTTTTTTTTESTTTTSSTTTTTTSTTTSTTSPST